MTPAPREDRITTGEEETVDAGRELGRHLAAGAVVRLQGDLGAGKTCFTRGLAEGLGADPIQVHSPSFSLVHLYRTRSGVGVLHHVDLYRIDSATDLREIGLDEILVGKIPVAVEWAERLRDSRFTPVPGDWTVRLEVVAPDQRRLRIRPVA